MVEIRVNSCYCIVLYIGIGLSSFLQNLPPTREREVPAARGIRGVRNHCYLHMRHRVVSSVAGCLRCRIKPLYTRTRSLMKSHNQQLVFPISFSRQILRGCHQIYNSTYDVLVTLHQSRVEFYEQLITH